VPLEVMEIPTGLQNRELVPTPLVALANPEEPAKVVTVAVEMIIL
jgi:hypothetical protein